MNTIKIKSFKIIVLLAILFSIGIADTFSRPSARRGGSGRHHSKSKSKEKEEPGQLQATKDALKEVHKKVGKQPKAEPGKFGSPQRGNDVTGYRLDPGHPNKPSGHAESGPHINYWDYSGGKRKKGGISGAEPIDYISKRELRLMEREVRLIERELKKRYYGSH